MTYVITHVLSELLCACMQGYNIGHNIGSNCLYSRYLQEAFLLRVDVVEWDVHVIGVLTNKHGMPLTECAPPNILSTDANVEACKAMETKAKHIRRNLQYVQS